MSTISTADSGPISMAVAVTPSDATVLAPKARGLYVGGTGSVVVTFSNDVDVTLVGVAAGVWHPVANIKKIKAASTATSIVVGY